jgi:hypothetical protein
MKRRAGAGPHPGDFTQKQHLRRPPPIKHTYKTSEVEAKRPRVQGCPNCGLNHRLGEIDLIPGAALGHFDKNGFWKFDGETTVFWDWQRQEHDPARFVCLNCDTVFDLSGTIY